MKLQAKFTLNFIFLVLVTIVISFVLIHWSVQAQFQKFMDEKNQEWTYRVQIGNHDSNITGIALFPPRNIPFEPRIGQNLENETPEDRYLSTVSRSLILAAAIDIVLAIILAYLLSTVLLKKIHRLKSAMHQYMDKGTSRSVLHGKSDEVDDLANMYNSLIEKVEKEEKIRKDFFIDMSHELRTPLTSIKGYLEGLIDSVFEKDRIQEIQEKTLQETDRMIRLVKEMSTLAKLEVETNGLEKESVDLGKITHEVIDMFNEEIAEKQLVIAAEGDAKALVDPYKFKQVIINLLDNAIHHGPAGNTIHIRIKEEENGLLWSIRNKAENVNPKDLVHFFERFYRADKSRTYNTKKPHLGIGLNIVKKIVEQHGGSISARMEGEEIIFEIILPR